jgi:hypothetical protein
MNNIPLPIVITIAFIILAIIAIIVCFQFMTANRLIERLKKHHKYQLYYNEFMIKGFLDDPVLQKNEHFQNILHKLNEKFHKQNENFYK